MMEKSFHGFVEVLISVVRLSARKRIFFIRNLARGLVLEVPYFRTSFYQILVLKVP